MPPGTFRHRKTARADCCSLRGQFLAFPGGRGPLPGKAPESQTVPDPIGAFFAYLTQERMVYM